MEPSTEFHVSNLTLGTLCLSEANMAVRVSMMVMAMASRSAMDCGGTNSASHETVR